MDNGIRLAAPIDITADDVERALQEYFNDEPTAHERHDTLRASATSAAAELNQVLDIDVFELLVRGWATVPAVRRAVQLSALTPTPPAIIQLDEHTFTSTSHPVLDIKVGQNALPELKLVLELIADVQSATLAVQQGQIELVALGETSVAARLRYKSALIKAHATGVKGARRDPFKRDLVQPDQRAGVDFYI
ncbi:MAG: hypothetical protein ABJA83_05375 [Burkholderiaceae bacterium]